MSDDINELKKENEKLKKDVEKLNIQINELNTKIKNYENIDENIDSKKLISILNTTFLNFNTSLESFEKKNSSQFQKDYLNLFTSNIENKIKLFLDEINIFREENIKNLTDKYEKKISLLNEEIASLKLNLSKTENQNSELNQKLTELNQLNLINEDKIKVHEKLTENLNMRINTQKNNIDLLNKKVDELSKTKNELDDSLNKTVLNYQMKEDEVESLIMIFDAMLKKNKDKYLHNLKRLSQETSQEIEDICNLNNVFNNNK